jgi:hypothetical protein
LSFMLLFFLSVLVLDFVWFDHDLINWCISVGPTDIGWNVQRWRHPRRRVENYPIPRYVYMYISLSCI